MPIIKNGLASLGETAWPARHLPNSGRPKRAAGGAAVGYTIQQLREM
jgi:hypothetical protein